MIDFIKLEEFGTKAQSIAPIGIVMSFFTFILKQKNIQELFSTNNLPRIETNS
ncbi:MAG: hypothetical protein ACFNZE_00995 [Scardovia wiggsiae]